MTNSERRISRVRAAVPPPGEALPDWRIVVDFSRRLQSFFPGKDRLFPYQSPEDIFNEHRETTRGRDLDITGLSYAVLDARGPQQWPFPQDAAAGAARLYTDGRFPTPSGRARFVATAYRPVAEDTDERYPLRLTTGRSRDQWHTMSRTGTIASLFGHEPEPRLKAHPEDLLRCGLRDSELAKISSRRGHLYAHAEADADMPAGVVFLPMHWGARFLGGAGRRGVNELTLAALDPDSKQPELKHCAVSVEPADFPWRLVAFGQAGELAALESALAPVMSSVPYALRTLIGRDRPGVRLALAAKEPIPPDLERLIDTAFGLDGADAIVDEGGLQRAALEGDALRAVKLSGATGAERWLRELWESGASAAQLRRRRIFLPPENMTKSAGRGSRSLCNCFGVAESEIDAFLAKSRSLEALQASLKCGTNCGSCLPELRRKLAA